MADQKISELTSVTNIESTDAFVAVDATDNTTKQVAYSDLVSDLEATMDIETTAQLNARDTANRQRGNHTGTQLASTISDFDTEVANNTDVAANTAKVGYTDGAVDARLTAKGIEDGATADQTDSEIVTAVNNELGNTDWQTQISALTSEQVQDIVGAMFEAGSHTNITVNYNDATNSISLSGSAGGGGGSTLTQEEVEDYVGGVVAGGTGITATYNDAGNELSISLSGVSFTSSEQTKLAGIATGATANDTDANLKTRSNHTGTQTASTISDFATAVSTNTAVVANTAKISYTDAAKVATIETNADVTDTANVTAAGALMDSEVTNLAQVKAFDTSDYATAAQGTTADSAMQNLVEDTAPQLGGELDAQANSIGFTLQTATGDGATTIDWTNGNKFQFTFGAFNETFTFTNPTKPCTLMLTLIQDATGSRTAIFPATVKWAGGTAPTLSTAATARDKIALDWDGTQYDAVASLNFS